MRNRWPNGFSRWGRRHRSWVRAGLASLAVVAMVSTASAVMINKALVQVEQERDRVVDNFKLAFENNSAIVELADEFEKQVGTNLQSVTRILSVVDGNFQKMLKDPANPELESLVRQGRGELHNSLAKLEINLGQTGKSLKEAETANAIVTKLLKTDAENKTLRQELATSHQNLGIAKGTRGPFRGSPRRISHRRPIARRLAQAGSRECGMGKRAGFRRANGGTNVGTAGRSAGGGQTLSVCMEIRKKLYEQKPHDPDRRGDYALMLWRMAAVHERAGKPQQQMQDYEEALELFEKLTQEQPGLVRWQKLRADLQFDLGNTVLNQGDTGRAVKLFQSAQETAERFLRLDPHNAEWKRILLGCPHQPDRCGGRGHVGR